jgi:hypothetical protein
MLRSAFALRGSRPDVQLSASPSVAFPSNSAAHDALRSVVSETPARAVPPAARPSRLRPSECEPSARVLSPVTLHFVARQPPTRAATGGFSPLALKLFKCRLIEARQSGAELSTVSEMEVDSAVAAVVHRSSNGPAKARAGFEGLDVRSPPALRFGKRKRCVPEERPPFSEAEESQLREGVKAWGAGNWLAILCGGSFDARRTPVELEEKWRELSAADDDAAPSPPQRALLLQRFNSVSALRGRQLQQTPGGPSQQPPEPPLRPSPPRVREEQASAEVLRDLMAAAEALEGLA